MSDLKLFKKLRTIKMVHPSEEELEKFFNTMSSNVMTPERIDVGYSNGGEYLYEICEGTNIVDDPIYGVTVMKWNESKKRYEYDDEYSELVYVRSEVESVVKRIGK